MQKMEILAPVGGPAQLSAAVRCGADAVYLGTKAFNARRNAENFAQTTLAQTVAYCHARNVSVYVTVNTLVTDDELPELLNTLDEIQQSGADAIIVQDLAVARLAALHCPALELHASTQMTIHNAEGAQQLSALGFTRAVLARELTLDEILMISQRTSLSLEVFVHGALCMSVSGTCYLSSMLGGRSGNRGLCAQPCRLPFVSGKRAYALSLRDLSALQHIQALQNAGVCALKIEGRMKRPEYVAAAVTACRQAVNQEPYDLQALEAAFSRSGFTDGYLTGKRDLSMYGVRGPSDIEASQSVYSTLAALYRHERQSVPVTMSLWLTQTSSSLTITDGMHQVLVHGETPAVAHTASTTAESARKSLAKTGGTPFYLDTLLVDVGGPVMLPAAALNAMRRDGLAQLLQEREKTPQRPLLTLAMPTWPAHQTKKPPAYRLRFEHADQLFDAPGAEKIILPIKEITPAILSVYGGRLIGELPALVFPNESQAIAKRLAALSSLGLTSVQVDNIGGITLAKAESLCIYGGAGLNIMNTLSLEAYASLSVSDCTVSFEMHHLKLSHLGGVSCRGAIAYGYLPLMRFRNCPVQGQQLCGACNGFSAIQDRTGVAFPLVCHDKQYTTMLNSLPLYVTADELPGADFLTLFFTTEDSATCRGIYQRMIVGETFDKPRTRGMYYRTLL